MIVTAAVWMWNAERGSWHFITVPPEQSEALRVEGFARRAGFGSVKVEAAVGEVIWRTSVFPHKDGGYLLPIKADVRRRADIAAGEEVTVRLKIL